MTVQLVVFLLVLLPGFVWQGAGVARAAAWAGAALLAYPFLRIASGYDWLLLGAAWLVTAFILYGFILWGRRKWGSTRETLPMVSLVIVGLAFFIPWRTAFEWRSAPGLDALVCLVGSEGFAGEFPVGWADGVLIGENNNYIYIGQKKRSGGRDPQIAQIPREHIGIVVVGEDADLQEGRELCGGMSTTRVMPWTGCKRKGDYRSRSGNGAASSGGWWCCERWPRVRGIVTFGPSCYYALDGAGPRTVAGQVVHTQSTNPASGTLLRRHWRVRKPACRHVSPHGASRLRTPWRFKSSHPHQASEQGLLRGLAFLGVRSVPKRRSLAREAMRRPVVLVAVLGLVAEAPAGHSLHVI